MTKARLFLEANREDVSLKWHKPSETEIENYAMEADLQLVSSKVPTDIDEADQYGVFLISKIDGDVEIGFATSTRTLTTIDYSGRNCKEVADEWEAPSIVTEDWLQEEGFRG